MPKSAKKRSSEVTTYIDKQPGTINITMETSKPDSKLRGKIGDKNLAKHKRMVESTKKQMSKGMENSKSSVKPSATVKTDSSGKSSFEATFKNT